MKPNLNVLNSSSSRGWEPGLCAARPLVAATAFFRMCPLLIMLQSHWLLRFVWLFPASRPFSQPVLLPCPEIPSSGVCFLLTVSSVWMPLETWPWVTSALLSCRLCLCGTDRYVVFSHLCLSLPSLVYFYPIPLETELRAYLFNFCALGAYNSDRQVQAFNLLYTWLWMNEYMKSFDYF